MKKFYIYDENGNMLGLLATFLKNINKYKSITRKLTRHNLSVREFVIDDKKYIVKHQ